MKKISSIIVIDQKESERERESESNRRGGELFSFIYCFFHGRTLREGQDRSTVALKANDIFQPFFKKKRPPEKKMKPYLSIYLSIYVSVCVCVTLVVSMFKPVYLEEILSIYLYIYTRDIR